MSKVEYVKLEPSGKKKSEVPFTITWNNAKMIRMHSIRAAVREILNLSIALDVVKINIIGPPSTGKTECARTIGHLCHDLGKIPYAVKILNRNDLLNIEETLATLQPTNHVLIFEDISFLNASAGKRHIDIIQRAFTEIRHLPGGQDVKIIAIFNFHYNMAVPKYLRQSDFFIYTAIGSSELENTQNIIGKRYTRKILEFRKICQQALTTGKYAFEFAKSKFTFTYPYRNPFAPLLFYNNDTCRVIVFPKREWIQPACPTCTHSSIRPVKKEMDLKTFDDDVRSRFGERIVRSALRIKLFNIGVNTYPKRVKQCMKYVEEYMKLHNHDPEQMADYYGLRDEPTRLDLLPT